MKEYIFVWEDKVKPVQITITNRDFHYPFKIQRNTKYYITNGNKKICGNEILYINH
jgi:hypothetical protein